jgi:predicted MPP superfamily phosphohydrolase
MMESSRQLRILLVSDIHLAFGYIDKLVSWLQKTNGKFDYILGSGDFANINHSVEEEDIACKSVSEMIKKKYEE